MDPNNVPQSPLSQPPVQQPPAVQFEGEPDFCTSGKSEYFCRPGEEHRHWNPNPGSCDWPKPCKAACFDHKDRRDWIDVLRFKPRTKEEDEACRTGCNDEPFMKAPKMKKRR